ncbi:hypothetical protein COHA_000133, partial [Chlorella ohadii]
MRVFHRLGANHHVGPLAVWLTAPASKAEGDARAHLDRGNGSNTATRLVVQGHERGRQEAIALEEAPEDRKDTALGLFAIAQRDIRIIPEAVLVAFSDGRDAQAAVQAGGFKVDGRCYNVYKMPPPSDYIWNTRQRSPATAVLTALALGLVLFLGLFVARGMFTGHPGPDGGAGSGPRVALELSWQPGPGESPEGVRAWVRSRLESLQLASAVELQTVEAGRAWVLALPAAASQLLIEGFLAAGVAVAVVQQPGVGPAAGPALPPAGLAAPGPPLPPQVQPQ